MRPYTEAEVRIASLAAETLPAGVTRLASHDQLVVTYNDRLRRLVRARRLYASECNEAGVQLVQHCIFASYTALIDLDARELADETLTRVPRFLRRDV